MKFYTCSLVCLLFCLSSTAYTSEDHHHHEDDHHDHHEEDEFTEHKAHEHGHAQATISYSDNELIFSFVLPSIDVFGFEHKAKTEQEISTIKDMLTKLSALDNIFTLEPSCDLESSEINSREFDEQAETVEAHSDVEITTHLHCNNMQARDITFTLFETLPSLEELSIEYISDKKQAIHSLTANENTITAE